MVWLEYGRISSTSSGKISNGRCLGEERTDGGENRQADKSDLRYVFPRRKACKHFSRPTENVESPHVSLAISRSLGAFCLTMASHPRDRTYFLGNGLWGGFLLALFFGCVLFACFVGFLAEDSAYGWYYFWLCFLVVFCCAS